MGELDDEITNEIFLEELKKEFAETAARNVQEMGELLGKLDYNRLAEIAHDIKGTAGLFGYDEGSKLADKIVIAARGKKPDDVGKYLSELKIYFQKNEVI
jgi:HPt (histidine-containing phosphotransfer) domain-containing protein